MTVTIVGPIVAKYGSWCLSCGASIYVGQKVYWVKGVGAWHEDCDRPRSLTMYEKDAQQRSVTRPQSRYDR